jgi:DNA polymerase-3 subunit beta
MNIFTFTKAELMPALIYVMSAVEKKAVQLVLTHILVEISDNTLKMTATDLEIELICSYHVTETNNGKFLIPARKFFDIINTLPEDKNITMEVGSNILVKCGRAKYKLETQNAQDFPNIEEWDEMHNLKMKANTFSNQITSSSYAMGNQDVRTYLNGMNITVKDKLMTMVATDGHRLAICEENVESGDIEANIILPRKAILDLIKQIPKSDEQISVSLGNNHFRVTWGGFSHCTKLIVGKFPDYKRVMPDPSKGVTVVSLNIDELRNKLNAVQILANEKFKGVRLMFSTDTLTLQSNNPEQDEAEEVIENISNITADSTIGFNGEYLAAPLGVMDTKEVDIIFGDATTSAIIRPKGVTNQTHICMPMRL